MGHIGPDLDPALRPEPQILKVILAGLGTGKIKLRGVGPAEVRVWIPAMGHQDAAYGIAGPSVKHKEVRKRRPGRHAKPPQDLDQRVVDPQLLEPLLIEEVPVIKR